MTNRETRALVIGFLLALGFLFMISTPLADSFWTGALRLLGGVMCIVGAVTMAATLEKRR